MFHNPGQSAVEDRQYTTDKAQRLHLSNLVPRTDSRFELHYFAFVGQATEIRAMLALAQADWKERLQDFSVWATEKPHAPFGTLPVLYETTSSGETLIIPERDAIEWYLARKLSFYGSNAWEQVQIDVAVSLHKTLFTSWQHRILYAPDDSSRAKNLDEFIHKTVPTWVSQCEDLLAKNGTGFFVGDRISLADIAACSRMDVLLCLDAGNNLLAPEVAPHLRSLKRRIDSQPSYQAYRQSEDFALFFTNSKKITQPKVNYDPAKAGIFC